MTPPEEDAAERTAADRSTDDRGNGDGAAAPRAGADRAADGGVHHRDAPRPDRPADSAGDGATRADPKAAEPDDGDPNEEDADDEEPVWYETGLGRTVVLVYLAATAAGVVVSVRDVGAMPLLQTGEASGAHPVPGFVYLYAFMGASAYAVTSLVSEDKTTDEVVKLGLRVVAALPLAMGIWALAPAFGGEQNTRLVAGLAFLAGLYVNLALKAFGALAERLLSVSRSD